MRRLVAMLLALLSTTIAAATGVDATVWQRVGFDQRLGERLPLATTFTDEDGRPIALAEALHGRPAVLVLNYYDCPNLCGVVLKGAFEGLARVGLAAGRDFELVSVSIDPRDTSALARTTKATYLSRFHREADGAGIHFLTGTPAAIDALTGAVGFRYVYDDALKQYAHAAGLVVVAPDGRISRYLFGAQFTTLSLRLALVDATQGAIGSLADRVWLLCYHYDPVQGRYGLAIVTILKGLGIATAAGLAGYLAVALRRERRKQARTVTA